MECFTLIVRRNIIFGVDCKKETLFLTKEEIVQQIRTNFAMYTEYVPSTTMVMVKLDEHLIKCSSVNHIFFEVEPVCSISKLNSGTITLQRDLHRCLHFMKHLATCGKKVFLNKYLFDLVNINADTFKFWLDPPHFESNVDKLISSICGFNFARDIKLEKYKQHLQKHFNGCKGPCKLNVFGVPTCKKTKCEIDKLDKMFYALYIFMESESTVQLRQLLFDMIYDVNQYNNVVDFMAINASRNTKLQKIIKVK